MDFTGALRVKNSTQKVSDNFRKREFVVTESSSQYPQHILVQPTQDRCELLDKFNVGDVIKVHFNLRGREWESPKGEVKFFNSIEAWKLDGVYDDTNNVAEEHYDHPAAHSGPADDLPF